VSSTRPRLALVCALACGLAATVSACGSSTGRAPQNPVAETPSATTTAPEPSNVNRGDKRGPALGCIHAKGIDAVTAGEKSIQVEGPDGPRIDFFQSSLEAEGEQFEGNGEGAEQIGAALLYVRGADDNLLNSLELCLNEQ
jgi:hypothetical protein